MSSTAELVCTTAVLQRAHGYKSAVSNSHQMFEMGNQLMHYEYDIVEFLKYI